MNCFQLVVNPCDLSVFLAPKHPVDSRNRNMCILRPPLGSFILASRRLFLSKKLFRLPEMIVSSLWSSITSEQGPVRSLFAPFRPLSATEVAKLTIGHTPIHNFVQRSDSRSPSTLSRSRSFSQDFSSFCILRLLQTYIG